VEHSQSTAAGLLLAGRYRLGETIGRGGMGKVWRAHDELLHRVVAVKELTAGRYVSEADRVVLHARTQKEARAAARISHPGVVTVHDVLEYDSRPWIVMQYVDGPSLADEAKESGRIPAAEAARIGLQVLRALGAAHAAGVLHRDVKPANVLLNRDGRVLITDFGIAAIEGDSTITRTGEIVGSIDYLAPERVRGADPGPASDLWSLGVTLYTAVEGESPFRRSSPLSTMQAVVGEEPRHPDSAGLLAPLIMALLRKDPATRPSAADAERMLLEAMEERAQASAQAQIPTQRMTRLSTGPQTMRQVSPVSLTPSSSGPVATSSGPASASAVAASPGGGRLRRAVIVVVLAAVVGGGAGLAALKYGGGGNAGSERTDNRSTESDTSSAQPGASSTVPRGWHRVNDPAGFSLLVPYGWKRQTAGDLIDYTPDNGRHRLRISSDASPDFENPYMHMLDLEKGLKKRLPKYQKLSLGTNNFRDRRQAALWEFTWTEKQNFPGPRRAIDQMYYTDDGTEYALFMSAPARGWGKARKQFDTMLRSWQPPA
jgi:serine/threonine protein kinase